MEWGETERNELRDLLLLDIKFTPCDLAVLIRKPCREVSGPTASSDTIIEVHLSFIGVCDAAGFFVSYTIQKSYSIDK